MKPSDAKRIVKDKLDEHGPEYITLSARTEKSFLCTQTGEPYVTVTVKADKPSPTFGTVKAETPPGIIVMFDIPNTVQV